MQSATNSLHSKKAIKVSGAPERDDVIIGEIKFSSLPSYPYDMLVDDLPDNVYEALAAGLSLHDYMSWLDLIRSLTPVGIKNKSDLIRRKKYNVALSSCYDECSVLSLKSCETLLKGRITPLPGRSYRVYDQCTYRDEFDHFSLLPDVNKLNKYFNMLPASKRVNSNLDDVVDHFVYHPCMCDKEQCYRCLCLDVLLTNIPNDFPARSSYEDSEESTSVDLSAEGLRCLELADLYSVSDYDSSLEMSEFDRFDEEFTAEAIPLSRASSLISLPSSDFELQCRPVKAVARCQAKVCDKRHLLFSGLSLAAGAVVFYKAIKLIDEVRATNSEAYSLLAGLKTLLPRKLVELCEKSMSWLESILGQHLPSKEAMIRITQLQLTIVAAYYVKGPFLAMLRSITHAGGSIAQSVLDLAYQVSNLAPSYSSSSITLENGSLLGVVASALSLCFAGLDAVTLKTFTSQQSCTNALLSVGSKLTSIVYAVFESLVEFIRVYTGFKVLTANDKLSSKLKEIDEFRLQNLIADTFDENNAHVQATIQDHYCSLLTMLTFPTKYGVEHSDVSDTTVLGKAIAYQLTAYSKANARVTKVLKSGKSRKTPLLHCIIGEPGQGKSTLTPVSNYATLMGLCRRENCLHDTFVGKYGTTDLAFDRSANYVTMYTPAAGSEFMDNNFPKRIVVYEEMNQVASSTHVTNFVLNLITFVSTAPAIIPTADPKQKGNYLDTEVFFVVDNKFTNIGVAGITEKGAFQRRFTTVVEMVNQGDLMIHTITKTGTTPCKYKDIPLLVKKEDVAIFYYLLATFEVDPPKFFNQTTANYEFGEVPYLSENAKRLHDILIFLNHCSTRRMFYDSVPTKVEKQQEVLDAALRDARLDYEMYLAYLNGEQDLPPPLEKERARFLRPDQKTGTVKMESSISDGTSTSWWAQYVLDQEDKVKEKLLKPFWDTFRSAIGSTKSYFTLGWDNATDFVSNHYGKLLATTAFLPACYWVITALCKWYKGEEVSLEGDFDAWYANETIARGLRGVKTRLKRKGKMQNYDKILDRIYEDGVEDTERHMLANPGKWAGVFAESFQTKHPVPKALISNVGSLLLIDEDIVLHRACGVWVNSMMFLTNKHSYLHMSSQARANQIMCVSHSETVIKISNHTMVTHHDVQDLTLIMVNRAVTGIRSLESTLFENQPAMNDDLSKTRILYFNSSDTVEALAENAATTIVSRRCESATFDYKVGEFRVVPINKVGSVGECGQPYFFDKSKGGRFAGIHTASDASYSYFTPVTRETLNQLFGKALLVNHKLSDLVGVKSYSPFNNVVVPSKDDHKQTFFYEKISDQTGVTISNVNGPALLNNDAMMANLAKVKHDHGSYVYNDDAYDVAVSVVSTLIKLQTNGKMFTPLDSLEETLKGLPNMNSLNYSTSSGFYGKLNPEFSKKSDLVISREEHIPKPEMQSLFDYEVENQTRKVSVSQLKVETRPFQEDGKVKLARLFSSGDIRDVLIGRKLFGKFINEIQGNAAMGPVLVGIDPFGRGWHVMTSNLLAGRHQSECNFIAGDFSGFDYVIPPKVMHSAFEIIKSRFPEEHHSDIETYESMILRSMHSYQNVLYAKVGGNVSGGPLTSIINSICNAIMCYYAIAKVLLRRDDLDKAKLPAYIRLNVSAIFYGDDSVICVHSRCKEVNMIELHSAFKQMGIKYTNSEKGTPTIPYDAPKDIVFQQRDLPIYGQEKRYGKRKIVDIINQLYYMKPSTIADYSSFNNAVSSALLDLSLYPEDVYSHYANQIKKLHDEKYNLLELDIESPKIAELEMDTGLVPDDSNKLVSQAVTDVETGSITGSQLSVPNYNTTPALSDLEQVLSRMTLIKRFTWGSSFTFEYQSLPNDLFSIGAPFSMRSLTTLIKYDIEVTVKVAGNSLVGGVLMCSWMPAHIGNMGVVSDVETMIQRPRLDIPVNGNTSHTIVIPYNNIRDYISPNATMAYMAFRPLVPLTYMGDTPPSVQFNVYARLINVSAMLPKTEGTIPMVHSREEFQLEMDIIRKAEPFVKSVIGDDILSTGKGIIKNIFGFDNPTSTSISEPCMIDQFGTNTYSRGLYNGTVASVARSNLSSCDQRLVGDIDYDGTLLSIAKKEGLIARISLTESVNSYAIPVNIVNVYQGRKMAPVTAASSSCVYWRGSLKYTVYYSIPGIMQAQVLFSLNPPAATSISELALQTLNVMKDISGTGKFDIIVPFAADTNVQPVRDNVINYLQVLLVNLTNANISETVVPLHLTVTVSAHDDFEWFFIKDNYIDLESEFITDSCKSIPADDRLTNQRVTHQKDITSRLSYRTLAVSNPGSTQFAWNPHPLLLGFAYTKYSTRFSVLSTKPALIRFTPSSGDTQISTLQGAYMWDSSVQNSYNIEVPWLQRFNCAETSEFNGPLIPRSLGKITVNEGTTILKDGMEGPLKLCVMTSTGDDLIAGCWFGITGTYTATNDHYPTFTTVDTN